MSDLARTQELVGGLLTEIGMHFKGSPKLTVIVRPIGFGDADFILTNDTLDEAIAALERQKLKGQPA